MDKTRLVIELDEEEHKNLTETARALDLSVSDYARQSLLALPVQPQGVPASPPKKELAGGKTAGPKKKPAALTKESLVIELDEEEHKNLAETARALDLNVSDYARQSLLALPVQPQGVPPSPPKKKLAGKKTAAPKKKLAAPKKKLAATKKKLAAPKKKLAATKKKTAAPKKKAAAPKKKAVSKRK